MTSERIFVYITYQFWDGILNSTGVKHYMILQYYRTPCKAYNISIALQKCSDTMRVIYKCKTEVKHSISRFFFP